MNVSHIAIARDDSSVIYIIENGMIRKSTNGGADFIGLSMPKAFSTPPRAIAVAPDSSDVVALVDSRPGGNKVWLSTNGGNLWNDLGTPKNGINAIVTGVAISPAMGSPSNRNYFATVADNRPGVTVRGDVMVKVGGLWNSIGGVSTTHDYMAICISPEYIADESVCVVGVTPANGVDYQLIKNGAKTVTLAVKFIASGVTDYCVPPAQNSITNADIRVGVDAVSADERPKVAFISVLSNTLNRTDGVYRVFDVLFERLTVFPNDGGLRIKSLDFDGEGLLAGEKESVNVWVCSNPMTPAPSWDKVVPPGGERETVVGIKNPNCYAGTSGTKSGFFIL